MEAASSGEWLAFMAQGPPASDAPKNANGYPSRPAVSGFICSDGTGEE
jgi:hypothetical protein